jgi:hypothetical protein
VGVKQLQLAAGQGVYRGSEPAKPIGPFRRLWCQGARFDGSMLIEAGPRAAAMPEPCPKAGRTLRTVQPTIETKGEIRLWREPCSLCAGQVLSASDGLTVASGSPLVRFGFDPLS